MTEQINTPCHPQTMCPRSCPCPIILDIATSIAHQEDALACILNAECAKVNKIVSTHSDIETLLAIDTSVQVTLQRITELEGVLKAKLDSILPLLTDCEDD
ncbi:MAG: hypothetical protein ACI4OO_06115 [Otoolea sp.]|nr:hypothetical protein [Clostridium sp.]